MYRRHTLQLQLHWHRFVKHCCTNIHYTGKSCYLSSQITTLRNCNWKCILIYLHTLVKQSQHSLSLNLVQCMNGVNITKSRSAYQCPCEAVHDLFTADAVSRCPWTQAVQPPRMGEKVNSILKGTMEILKFDISFFSGWVTQSPMLCLYLEGQELAREPNAPG